MGSSKKTRLGFPIISTPMLTLFFSPPEMPLTKAFPILVFALFAKPSSLMTFSATSCFLPSSTPEGNRSSAAINMVSRTVRDENKASSWTT